MISISFFLSSGVEPVGEVDDEVGEPFELLDVVVVAGTGGTPHAPVEDTHLRGAVHCVSAVQANPAVPAAADGFTGDGANIGLLMYELIF